MAVRTLLVYAIGLAPYIARAVYADLPDALIRLCRPLRPGHAVQRHCQTPDLVLLDVSVTDVEAELAAARAAWGEGVIVVGLSRSQPLAHIWSAEPTDLVELGPGFLDDFLN